MAIAEVGTTTYATANTATITTASFTPANSTLLVAYCGMGNGGGAASSLGTVTDSLSGTWTRLKGDASATGGVAEIWARDIGTGASMTVTYDPGGTGASGLDIIVKWYSGAKPVANQPGATANLNGTSAYTLAITTTTTGSLVAGSYARATDTQTLTANASTTILGQVNGSSGDTAACFRATNATGTPGSTTLGFTNTAAVTNWIALAEILPAAGIAVDASTPARVTATTTAATTASFTPPAGSVVVACTCSTGGNQANPTITITNSGTALTWTQIQKATPTTTGGALDGCAAAHYAVSAGAAMTVTSTQTTGSSPTSLKCYVLTGVDTVTPLGATPVIGSSVTNNLTTSPITTASNNSLVMCVGTEWNVAGTAPTSSDLTADTFTSGTLLDGLSGYKTNTTAGTAQTANLDAPGTAAAEWMYVLFEIDPAAAAAAPRPIVISQAVMRSYSW